MVDRPSSAPRTTSVGPGRNRTARDMTTGSLAAFLLRRTRVRLPAVQSRPVYERPGYRTLLGRIRGNIRTYIRKQLELPRQEIAELLAANVRAAIFLVAIGLVAFLYLPELVLAALLLTIALSILTVGIGFGGYSRLELHGPTRTINSVKETIRWAKARLLGR